MHGSRGHALDPARASASLRALSVREQATPSKAFRPARYQCLEMLAWR